MPYSVCCARQSEHSTSCKLTAFVNTACDARRHQGIGEAHALVRSEVLLAARLRALAHSLSDANLSGRLETYLAANALQ